MWKRSFLLTVVVTAGALTVGACGSSKVSSTAGTTTAGATTVPNTGPPATTAGTGAAPGVPLFRSGPVPAVTGAADLSTEPVVGAGAAPAPAALTGEDLVVGTGPVAGPAATVNVQYVGTLYETGNVFDASWTDNGPTSFPLSGVIPGFKDAIIGMRVGGRREIVIPPALGYGASGQPPTIPANATLVFVIDLLGVS